MYRDYQELHVIIVTNITIARQRLRKHVPAATNNPLLDNGLPKTRSVATDRRSNRRTVRDGGLSSVGPQL
jgi:hypothetical protein